jgi:non-ribosomal peptide synthetase component F
MEVSQPDQRHILHSEGDRPEDFVIENVHTLPELLQWQAQRRSDAAFLSFRPQSLSDLITLSYSDAYTRSCSLAQSLQQLFQNSCTTNPVVGIWFERSIDLHLAILATTISGAAWLPFDADVPTERVKSCLKDSNAAILLCDEAHWDVATSAVQGLTQCQVVTFEKLTHQINNTDKTKTSYAAPKPHDTAYIIYTSGSSGTPKGIAISHHAALMFCLSERTILATGPSDIVWQGFSAAFDMFVEET